MKLVFTVYRNQLLIFFALLLISFSSSGQGTLEKHDDVVDGYDYIAFLPDGYDEDLKTDFPIIIYLHGGQGILDGDAGFEDFRNFDYGLPRLIHEKLNGGSLPSTELDDILNQFIIIVPHFPRDVVTFPDHHNDQLWSVDSIDNTMNHAFSEYYERVDQIYLSGISLGAKGVFDYAMAHPQIPAAVVPISGTGILNSACDMKDVPLWAFHGEKDYLIYNDESQAQRGRWGSKSIVDAINACPNPTYRANFTLFPYKIHEPAVWDNIYNLSSGYNIYDWLLKHERGATANIPPYGRITRSDQKYLMTENGELVIKLESDAFDTNFGDNLSYSWDLQSGEPGGFSFRGPDNQIISNPTGPSTFVVLTEPGSYVINLEVNDSEVVDFDATNRTTASVSDEVEINVVASVNDLYVSKLELYNAATTPYTYIKDLKNGDKIDTDELGINNFNIRAVLHSFSGVRSVRFSLDDDENFLTLNDGQSNQGTSYYMFTRRNGLAWTPADGEYKIAATPYADKNPSTQSGITNQVILYVNEDPPVILPVEFLDVSASKTGNQVIVNWSTASEQGNDFFTIERSPTASDHFEAIGTQKGAGDSNELKEYSFTDYAPLSGDAYYRIRQTDFDGKSNVSKIVHVKGTEAFKVNLFPNPTHEGFTFLRLFSPDIYSKVSVYIVDAVGNRIYQHVFSPELLIQEGGYKLLVNSHLSKGIYFVIVNQGENRLQQKLLVN